MQDTGDIYKLGVCGFGFLKVFFNLNGWNVFIGAEGVGKGLTGIVYCFVCDFFGTYWLSVIVFVCVPRKVLIYLKKKELECAKTFFLGENKRGNEENFFFLPSKR